MLNEKLAEKMNDRERDSLNRSAILGSGVGLGVGTGVATNSYLMSAGLNKAMQAKAEMGQKSMQDDVLNMYKAATEGKPRRKKLLDAVLTRAGVGIKDGLPDVSAIGRSQRAIVKPVPRKLMLAHAIVAGTAVGLPTALATTGALHLNDKMRYKRMAEKIKSKLIPGE